MARPGFSSKPSSRWRLTPDLPPVAKRRPSLPKSVFAHYLTPEIQEKIVSALQAGTPLRFAAMLAGVTEATVKRWLAIGRHMAYGLPQPAGQNVPAPFARRCLRFFYAVEQARAAFVARNMAYIQKAAAQGSWQAAAWALERTHPEHFAKETRLTVATVDRLETELRELLGPEAAEQLLEQARAEAHLAASQVLALPEVTSASSTPISSSTRISSSTPSPSSEPSFSDLDDPGPSDEPNPTGPDLDDPDPSDLDDPDDPDPSDLDDPDLADPDDPDPSDLDDPDSSDLPRPRVTKVTVAPARDPEMWPTVPPPGFEAAEGPFVPPPGFIAPDWQVPEPRPLARSVTDEASAREEGR
jgi:hypothetical protein